MRTCRRQSISEVERYFSALVFRTGHPVVGPPGSGATCRTQRKMPGAQSPEYRAAPTP